MGLGVGVVVFLVLSVSKGGAVEQRNVGADTLRWYSVLNLQRVTR